MQREGSLRSGALGQELYVAKVLVYTGHSLLHFVLQGGIHSTGRFDGPVESLYCLCVCQLFRGVLPEEWGETQGGGGDSTLETTAH